MNVIVEMGILMIIFVSIFLLIIFPMMLSVAKMAATESIKAKKVKNLIDEEERKVKP